jgi:hypothetical protein
MKCRRKFTALLLAVASMAVLAFAQKSSQAQVVVYGGYGGYYGGYGVYAAPAYAPVYAPAYAPVYASPVYAAPWYATPTPVYAAPAPVAYGAYYAPYPAVAPIGYGYPVNDLEVNYKYRHGLWYVDIDD